VDKLRWSLRQSFESAADLYDPARPNYPEQLFDDLVELAALRPGARLLEIGCATGKATRPLLERDLLARLRRVGCAARRACARHLADMPFEIHVAPFEAWENERDRFDLVFAATAWHWIDPAIRYRKAYEFLRPAGHPAFQWPPSPPDQDPDDVAEIEASGLFEEIRVRRYLWEKQYSADEYIALLNTFSGHIAMEQSKRARLYREIRHRIRDRTPPVVRRHWSAILHVARRKTTPA
jgi:SAM-dependent methyltransferase